MNVQNHTPFVYDLLLHARRDAGAFLTVIVKGTFAIVPDRPLSAAEEQLPVLVTPEYVSGENRPVLLRLESDRVPFKPRTDVVVTGLVHAPEGETVSALHAMLRVGSLEKILAVFGDRHWEYHGERPVISRPQAFTTMPLTYERAYGGVDVSSGHSYAPNPVGRGFVPSVETLNQTPLPNIEDLDHPIRSWEDRPFPAGFGFMDRGSEARWQYAGALSTFEEEDGLVVMPPDFRDDFYCGAHPDLQVQGYLRGDERVEMQHLTPEGYLRFSLPAVRPILTISKATGEGDAVIEPPLDTVVFLLEEGRVYQVWRGQLPLRRPDLTAIERIGLDLQALEAA